MAGSNSCGSIGNIRITSLSAKDKPFLTVDLAKDIARFNSNLSGVQLNAGTSLNCVMQKSQFRKIVALNNLNSSHNLPS